MMNTTRPDPLTGRGRAAAAVLGGLLAASCAAPPPATPGARPVHAVAVGAPAGQPTQTFSGVARMEMTASLGFKVTGTIRRLAVDVGDRVRGGDLIADLDPADYEIRLEAARAALRQVEARALSARNDLRRARRLYENGDGSRTALDQAATGVSIAAAEVMSAAKQVELAERQLAHTRLVAPETGVIAAVDADVNEYVVPGLPIVVLAAGAAREIGFGVPETRIGRIREGLPASVVFAAMPDRPFAGAVAEVGVTTSAASTTFPAMVRLDDVTEDVRAGMSADLTITLGDARDADRFVVPTRAVVMDGAGEFVFVANAAAGRGVVARRRPVTLGNLADGGVEVVDGLSGGEIIVTGGASRLADGDRIRVVDGLGGPEDIDDPSDRDTIVAAGGSRLADGGVIRGVDARLRR